MSTNNPREARKVRQPIGESIGLFGCLNLLLLFGSFFYNRTGEKRVPALRDRPQLVPLTEPDERWGMSPARRRKLQARAAEIIADEKSLRDLRQALALTEERINARPEGAAQSARRALSAL
jgi:hypothetical protein